MLVEADDAIILVSTSKVPFEEVDDHAVLAIGAGYEGLMVRLDEKYENKRSNSLIKWKEMQDAEYELVDVLPGVGNHAHVAASVVCKIGDKTFSAGMRGNRKFCGEFLANKDKYIGKPVTIIFQNLTPDGIPRFGKFKAVRDYE
jgi:DNA ligase-1